MSGRMCIELWSSKTPEFYPEDRWLERVVLIPRQTASPDTGWMDYAVEVPSVMTSNAERSTFPTTDLQMYFSGKGKSAGIWRTGLVELPFTEAERSPRLGNNAEAGSKVTTITKDTSGRVTAATRDIYDLYGNVLRRQTIAGTYTGNSKVGDTWTETEG
jgi:hypothetical protein